MNQHQRRFTCVRCGYDIIGAQVGSPCPECGHVIGSAVAHGGSNGPAVASLVLGIIALPSCILYGVPSLILGTLAIVFHTSARRKVLRGEADPSTLGIAKAGQICGIVALTLGAIFALLFFGGIILGLTTGSGGGGFQYSAPGSHPQPTTTP